MTIAPYFTPAYFTTFYFPDLAAVAVDDPSFPPPVTPTLATPVEILAVEAIARRLRDLNIFRDVLASAEPGADRLDVAGFPAAVIGLKGWSDSEENSTDQLRTADFTIRILDERDRPFSRMESLVTLGEAARQQVQHSDLDGLVLPALTRLKAGRFAKEAALPGSTLILEGEFAYLLDPSAVVIVRI